jgi:hypothetical protein
MQVIYSELTTTTFEQGRPPTVTVGRALVSETFLASSRLAWVLNPPPLMVMSYPPLDPLVGVTEDTFNRTRAFQAPSAYPLFG